ncbi:MAG: aminotransferase class IV [Isosphaeraceae bacterium]|nr:aminotransferase class IV [Isosphaeraceae bacterium]
MNTTACLNGVIGPIEEAKVSVWDRGFVFGDSVYEVFRLYAGRLWLEAEHLERLERSLHEVEFPAVDFKRLRSRIAATIGSSGVLEGTVYIQITRGVAPRAHAYPEPPVEPTELIVVRPYDDSATAAHREKGVAVISEPDRRWKRCDIKSTNLLANVMALEHAHRAGAFETILIDAQGRVTEATHSSLLWIRDGRLMGTPEGEEILPGTKRRFLRELAESLGIGFAEESISPAELVRQDEVVLTGTTIEVMPVIRIDDRTVGTGSPGSITKRLQAAYQAAVTERLRSH